MPASSLREKNTAKNAADLHWKLCGLGFRLTAKGGKLQVFPADSLTNADRLLIREHKAALIDVVYDFEERAAIREFNGGLCREDAEILAREDVRRAQKQQRVEVSPITATTSVPVDSDEFDRMLAAAGA